MEHKVKHVLGISGGKDSAALAIYLNDKYPAMDVEYYSCDTGKELDETYQLIKNLEIYLGKSIKVLNGVGDDGLNPFDHFLNMYGGFLPSTMSRWCTKSLKLAPFEKYIAGDQPIVSYVGIRGDEDREGYISKKPNIQSIFPFRKNIWSEDVVKKVLSNSNKEFVVNLYKEIANSKSKDRGLKILEADIAPNFTLNAKLDTILDHSIEDFNKIVFAFLQTTAYPLSKCKDFPLVNNEDILVRDDIFGILEDSGVGVPAYYKKREYTVEIDGKVQTGFYSRSRSGCFFCFFQQKIEWVWLYENHPKLYEQAKEYEKDGYTWQQGETLEELALEDRRIAIKREHFKRMKRNESKSSSPYLLDILADAETEGCAACFI